MKRRFSVHFFVKDGEKYYPHTEWFKTEAELQHFIDIAPRGCNFVVMDNLRVYMYDTMGRCKG